MLWELASASCGAILEQSGAGLSRRGCKHRIWSDLQLIGVKMG